MKSKKRQYKDLFVKHFYYSKASENTFENIFQKQKQETQERWCLWLKEFGEEMLVQSSTQSDCSVCPCPSGIKTVKLRLERNPKPHKAKPMEMDSPLFLQSALKPAS